MSEKSEKNDERDDAIPYFGTPYVEFTGYAFEDLGRLLFDFSELPQDVVPPGGLVFVQLYLNNGNVDNLIWTSPNIQFDRLVLAIFPVDVV